MFSAKYNLDIYAAIIPCLVFIIGGGFCCIGLWLFKKYSKGFKRIIGHAFCGGGMLVVIIFSIVLYSSILSASKEGLLHNTNSQFNRIARALKEYSNDNQGYFPEPDTWVETLQKNSHRDIETFIIAPSITYNDPKGVKREVNIEYSE